jgi:hypothetical protein
MGKSGSGNGGPGTTADERRADIDKRLDRSLGTVDSEVRKEQEKTAQERDARAAANAGSSGTADAEEGKDGNGDTAGTADTEGPGATGAGEGKDGKGKQGSRPGDLKSEKQRKAEGGANAGSGAGAGGSGTQKEGPGGNATEIPDGSDDDIVARRLRKAAEAETDPELKEKLWKEYIEYKKGAGSK